ncbi:MAG: hypothetical protein KC516_02235 [Nanoarchaeota archaeon]|nr:hypothetical protein [Nanoarchaeota archaeon]
MNLEKINSENAYEAYQFYKKEDSNIAEEIGKKYAIISYFIEDLSSRNHHKLAGETAAEYGMWKKAIECFENDIVKQDKNAWESKIKIIKTIAHPHIQNERKNIFEKKLERLNGYNKRRRKEINMMPKFEAFLEIDEKEKIGEYTIRGINRNFLRYKLNNIISLKN